MKKRRTHIPSSTSSPEWLGPLTPVISEEMYRSLKQENRQLKKEQQVIREKNQELVRIISEMNQLLVTEGQETTRELQRQRLYEVFLTLIEIDETDFSINEWIGYYLLAVKKEAKDILVEAVSMAEIITEANSYTPKEKPLLKSVTKVSPIASALKPTQEIKKTTPLYQLAQVKQTYQTQCEELKSVIEEAVPLLALNEDRGWGQ